MGKYHVPKQDYNSPAEMDKVSTEAASTLKKEYEINDKQKVMLILGSGCNGIADSIDINRIIPYKKIKGMPESTVDGHDGELILGELEGKEVLAFSGRNHFYEGNSAHQCSYMVHLADKLNAEVAIMTSAVGIAPERDSFVRKFMRKTGLVSGNKYSADIGDVMLIDTYNPNNLPSSLRGRSDSEKRFPAGIKAPNIPLSIFAEEKAQELGINLDRCCYVPRQGPVYETPAEVSQLSFLSKNIEMPTVGGMSLVPELEASLYTGTSALALAVVTNQMFDMRDKKEIIQEIREELRGIEYSQKEANALADERIKSRMPSHEEVAEVAGSSSVTNKLEKIVSKVVRDVKF